MSNAQRNYIQISVSGERTMMFPHGFSCGQRIWRGIVPSFRGVIPASTLPLIDNVGPYPHLNSPGASAAAISTFFRPLGR